MQILMANPRGFCAGVSRAIDVVEKVLALETTPVYVRHEVVHNRAVVQDLKQKGAIFVKEVDEIPDGAVCIFSAHGVSQAVQDAAKAKGLKVYDATCPLVTKVHREVRQASAKGHPCVLIGHKGHPEVDGTIGQYHPNDGQIYLVETVADVDQLDIPETQGLVYATQTTLSVDETKDIIARLKQRFPEIQAPKKADICYATQNRQDAVKSLAESVDLMIVVGSQNSSNSNRLKELAEQYQIAGYLVDDPAHLQAKWFDNAKVCGVTAGASAPEYLVNQVVDQIKQFVDHAEVKAFEGVQETVTFPLPKLLKTQLSSRS